MRAKWFCSAFTLGFHQLRISPTFLPRFIKFFELLNDRNPNIKFTIEKQITHSIAFLDVFISGIINQNFTLQTYQKSTYAGLLLNVKTFTLISYKISSIKCLIDRSFKICNNWNSFPNDIENTKSNLIKKAYPPFLIDIVIKKCLNYKFFSNQNQLNTNLAFITLNYHISATFYTISKINFWNFAKSFVRKILTLS